MADLSDKTEFGLMLFGVIAKSGEITDCGDITPIVNAIMESAEDWGFKITRPHGRTPELHEITDMRLLRKMYNEGHVKYCEDTCRKVATQMERLIHEYGPVYLREFCANLTPQQFKESKKP